MIPNDGTQGYWSGATLKGVSVAPDEEPMARSAPLRFCQRAVDIVFAATLLVLTAPVMLLLATLIRLDSPGPALFWQTRLGQDHRSDRDRRRNDARRRGSQERRRRERRARNLAGRPFKFVKFRTMFVDARERFPELYRYQYTDDEMQTLKFKPDDDPRLTRVGAFLRKTSVDELPNLWNVLLGHITLVGPRPEIPEMTPYYSKHQRLKFKVQPGVTGLAQINGRGRLTFQQTVKWDVEYVLRRSVGSDLMILWKTVVAVLRRDGAF